MMPMKILVSNHDVRFRIDVAIPKLMNPQQRFYIGYMSKDNARNWPNGAGQCVCNSQGLVPNTALGCHVHFMLGTRKFAALPRAILELPVFFESSHCGYVDTSFSNCQCIVKIERVILQAKSEERIYISLGKKGTVSYSQMGRMYCKMFDDSKIVNVTIN